MEQQANLLPFPSVSPGPEHAADGQTSSTLRAVLSEDRVSMSPPLRGLFYAQFDDTVGPQLVHVVPPELLTDAVREKVANHYVLPQPELCDSLITLRGIASLKIMSSPKFITSSIYPRHRFTFAFGMVFGQDDDVGPYGPVLRKIARFFHNLEKDSQFLSSGAGGKLGQLLLRIMEGLVMRGECIVRVLDAKSALALKLFPKLLDPPNVGDFQVPVFTRSLKNIMVKDWDFTIQRLEKHIDGKKFVKRIALEAGMDISLVKRALRQLLYYRVIVMLDVFQYSNLYACTKRIAELAWNEALQQECRSYVLKEGLVLRNTVPFNKIFQLYASLHPSAPFGDFCIAFNTEGLGIDDQRFVTFGLRMGILRRVRHVPIPLVYPLPTSTAVGSFGKHDDTQSAQLRALVDSERSFDELCGMTTFSFAEVNLMFEAMDDVVVVRM